MGTIATFYSYKGGVGRSMALANVASLLAVRGVRVLVVDFDLEAPGLDRYFTNFETRPSARGGLMDLLIDARNKSKISEFPNWHEYVSFVNIDSQHELAMLKAYGDDKNTFGQSLANFSWEDFFSNHLGGEFIEALRDGWKKTYDLVLVDSRTGLTDSGGICTIQLPDILVAVFTANNQSLFGVKEIISRAQEARQNLAYDRMPLIILPLASRFDGRTEFEESQHWLKIFSCELSEYFEDWIPANISAQYVVERIKIPHVAYFSFGEKLPVLTHSVDDPESIGYAYSLVASLLANDLQDSAKVLGVQPSLGYSDGKQKYDAFISYASEDRILARKLASRLQRDGVKVWFDQWEINPGDLISQKVNDALEQVRILLGIITENSKDYDFMERESKPFRYSGSDSKRFIPVVIGNARIPNAFEAFAYSRLQSVDDEKGYKILLDACYNTKSAISHDASRLLSLALEDARKSIFKVTTFEGLVIQVNGINLVHPGDAKSAAQWRSALQELINNELIEMTDRKGEVYAVTTKGFGYKLRDFL